LSAVFSYTAFGEEIAENIHADARRESYRSHRGDLIAHSWSAIMLLIRIAPWRTFVAFSGSKAIGPGPPPHG
jgi:hypothetical protein